MNRDKSKKQGGAKDAEAAIKKVLFGIIGNGKTVEFRTTEVKLNIREVENWDTLADKGIKVDINVRKTQDGWKRIVHEDVIMIDRMILRKRRNFTIIIRRLGNEAIVKPTQFSKEFVDILIKQEFDIILKI